MSLTETNVQNNCPLTEEEQAEIFDVVRYATEKHDGQTRKGGHGNLPYIIHPMSVLSMISQEWEITNFVLWKAAICHDILEDCGVDYDDLVEVIGDAAADVVQELTFIPDPHSGQEPHFQKRDYMRSFHDKSLNALIVKCADRCCNTCDFIATDPDYAVKYWKKANDLFDAMMTRGPEIIEIYGETAFPMMKYTRTLLGRQLVR